ncbi:peptide ABC transporter ATP-binding protein [Salinigranum rubrum]|uniref:Peptide ABC transporter ATP-binding protein n=1 Tax=Salinigranum rubrum TaxID=755307 RepID=A0A2I8VHK3_9EURY|nr:ABC transporter ATP-binding protein [Salinigranum rubrum]AUV81413.1 peptide ABC transporter ATP-binding protein [Salinigranum rubrum]
MPLLEVRNLEKHYPITEGLLKNEVGHVRAVDGVSFTVERGETLGIVGESGCGKSTAATSLLRLEEPTGGQVLFDGEDITTYTPKELKRFRRRAQMIFQDPTSSFDPRMSVGEAVAEPLVIHGIKERERRRRIVVDLLERVGLSGEDIDRYPHEFSGGQRQRIALARALVVNPDLIVADEPTSALDVSVQAEILTLIERVQAEFGLAIVFISHDMGVVREVCDRVAVMYLGEIVELGPTARVFEEPQHPYTRALLSSIPEPDPWSRGLGTVLTGDVPSPSNPPSGCRFHTRCPELVPPDGYDFTRGEWRAVMNLRVRLREEGIDVDAVREFVAGEREGVAETVDDDRVAEAVRAEFDIPDTLSDPSAERVVREALTDIVAGEGDAARDRLAEAFPTVCARERPPLDPVATGHEVACHLHRGYDSAPAEETAPGADE